MSRRRKGGHGGGHEGGDERWLLTYADMITLLLALFIVLFAMSSINETKFDEIKHSFSRSFPVLSGSQSVLSGSTSVLDPAMASQQGSKTVQQLDQEAVVQARRATEALSSKLRTAVSGKAATATGAAAHGKDGTTSSPGANAQADLAAAAAAKGVTVDRTSEGVVIRLANDLFFQSGSAQLNASALPVLATLASNLQAEGRPLRVEGNTDGAPLGSGGAYPDNMSLSQARAYAVWSALAGGGVPRSSMTTMGDADTNPVVEPPSPTASVAKNRRVDVVVLAPNGSDLPAAAAKASRSAPFSGGTGATANPVTGAGADIPDPVGDVIGSVLATTGAG